MKINYKLENKDIVDFNIYEFKKSKKFYITFILQSILPIVIFFMAASVIHPQNISKTKLYIIVCFISLAFLVFYRFFFFFSLKNKMMLILKAQKDPNTLEGKTLEFLEDKMVEGNGNTLKYSEVTHIKDAKNHIYIYKEKGSAYILPKKCLSPEELQYIKSIKV